MEAVADIIDGGENPEPVNINLEATKKAREELLAEDPDLKDFFNHPLNMLEVNEDAMNHEVFQSL